MIKFLKKLKTTNHPFICPLFQIHLPTGNTVDVYVTTYAPYFLNVGVSSSVNDVEQSRGMCGKMSITQNGDLIKRDGSLANTTEDFAESWR